MSIISRRKRRVALEGTPADELSPKRKRWGRRLAAMVLIVVILATWLLPVIVAHTPLLHWAVDNAAADLDGSVKIGSASLGWLSPIAIDGIEVLDSQGEPVLSAPKLRGDRWLISLLWDRSALGQFRLEKPRLNLVLHEGGSNLEDVAAAYLESTEASQPLDVGLTVVDGGISVVDRDTGKSWRIDDVQLALNLSPDAPKGLTLDTKAAVADASQPGSFHLEMSTGSGELTLQTKAVPMDMFRSVVGRFVPQTDLAGHLSCRIGAQWGRQETPGQVLVRADATTDDLLLAMPSLGSDRVRLDRLHTACRIIARDGRIEIENPSLECDVARLSASGTWELVQSEAGSRLASMLSEAHTVTAQIDLAKLAAMLPETLRVRDETQITSGNVQVSLLSQPDAKGMIWRGWVGARDLRAVHQGRPLTWRQPIMVTLNAHSFDEGPVIDKLKCESDFLEFSIAGTPNDMSASASFDLEQLARQLGQFVDVRDIGFGGDGKAKFRWRCSGGGQFDTELQLNVNDLQLALADGRTWKEEKLDLLAAAAGRTNFGLNTQLRTASLQIQAAADRLDARLTQPVINLTNGGSWSVEAKANGRLQGWPERLRAWAVLDDWQGAGNYDLIVQGDASKDGVTVRRARVNVARLDFKTPLCHIVEPDVALTASGGWDVKRGRLQLKPVTFDSRSLSIEADNVVLAMPEDAPARLEGTLKYQADLQQVSKWFADPATPPGYRIQGQLRGTSQLAQAGGVTNGGIDAKVGNLLITLPSGKQFQEPTVHLTTAGSYRHGTGLLHLKKLALRSDALSGNAAGQVATAAAPTDLHLQGELQYDLEKLTGLLEPYLGPRVQFVGRGKCPASFQGPLSMVDARAAGGARWQSAHVYGFPIGPGELKVNLAGGRLQAAPMDLAVSGGRMHLKPQVRLTPAPMELTLPQGPLATQVQITPAMCTSALQYIAPVLAGVTAAQGAFSIELQGCRIPLTDPARGELAGKLIVHSVEVAPGPLVRELAVVLGRAAPAKLRRESVVPFRMVDGRVHHSGLELVFPDVTVRTAGSVGLDRTLNLLAEMPVPPKWIGNNRLGTALRGQTIRLPIAGTLSEPVIDRRTLDAYNRRFVERGVQNVIENEVGRQLERLFGPQR